MQARAAEDLRKLVTDRLVAAGLAYEGAKAFATPRRLALSVHGVPARQPDIKEEKKGPRVGAPENAIAGFLKAAGLKSIDQAKIQPDKKGDFYLAVIDKPGRPAIDVVAEMMPEVVRGFPWPKSMRWGGLGGRASQSGYVRCIRSSRPSGRKPKSRRSCRSISTASRRGDETRGHRFHGAGRDQGAPFRRLRNKARKGQGGSRSDAPRRHDSCRRQEPGICPGLRACGGRAIAGGSRRTGRMAGDTDGLFRQEFPVDPRRSRSAPPSATTRSASCCAIRRRPNSRNKFILVANEEAADGGKAIVAGNERVIRARLSDAKFFYETDLKRHLEERLPKFEQIVFHEKLGTQAARIARIAALAGQLAPIVGADAAKAERAAQLCKTDLLTGVVGEFPELQGLMGRYYAEAQNEDEAVAHACEDHYRPKGPDDLVPS